jgi:hypothetical protein
MQSFGLNPEARDLNVNIKSNLLISGGGCRLDLFDVSFVHDNRELGDHKRWLIS